MAAIAGMAVVLMFSVDTVIGERWGMADVSSAPGSKLVLEGPLTDEWTDRTYRAASYPRHGGDLIDEAFGEWPEDALLNLLLKRNGSMSR